MAKTAPGNWAPGQTREVMGVSGVVNAAKHEGLARRPTETRHLGVDKFGGQTDLTPEELIVRVRSIPPDATTAPTKPVEGNPFEALAIKFRRHLESD